MIIAIDGPSGAGKSTIAKRLANRLKITYLDTGAMYRALALKIVRLGADAADERKVDNILSGTDISIEYTAGEMKIFLDGSDVSGDIRDPSIGKAASDISALKCVRYKMTELQRRLAAAGDTVLDGRDIGTFVLPDADFKFYLTAAVEERARRRYLELSEKGCECEYESVLKGMIERDYNDSHRALAPLKKAEDAVEIDSTELGIEEVVAAMEQVIGRGK